MSADAVTQEEEVAGGIFVFAEDGPHDGARRIVHATDERQARAAAFEPIVLAAVHLDQEPRPRGALPPCPIASWPSLSRAVEPGRQEQAADRAHAQADPLFMQHLLQVGVVVAHVGWIGSHLQDRGARARRQGMRRASPPVPVGERGRPFLPVRALQAEHLPLREL
jgi:hypothetical protein